MKKNKANRKVKVAEQSINPHEGTGNGNNILQSVLQSYDEAAQYVNMPSGIYEMLRQCKRELTVSFPVRMDDGTVKTFTGYRVHHNTVRGPLEGRHSLPS